MIRYVIVLSLLILPLIGKAQNAVAKTESQQTKVGKFIHSTDYRIALQNVGIGMPPNFVNGKAHPGLFIGLEKKFSDSSRWDYQIDLGYFAIHSLERAAYLKPGIGYLIALGKSIELRPNLNFAIMGVGQINDEFQLVNGIYEKAARHRLQVAPGLGLETFIHLAKSEQFRYEALLGYEFAVQLPFSSLSSILPLNQLKLGVRLKRN